MTVVVGISGLNAVDNPGPGVGVARSLREDAELDVQVIGLAYNALEPGIYMNWVVDRSFTMPYPSGSAEDYLARLQYIQAATGLQCLIPCLDAELPLLIRFREHVEAMGIRICLPTMAQFRLRGKDGLPGLAADAQLKLPETIVVNDEAELCRAVEQIGLPFYVKGIYYDARLVLTLADAVSQFRRLLADWGGPVIVQQAIAGDELNVVGVGDGRGGVLGLVGAKKTYVTAQGKMWGGVTVRHPEMLAAAERFVRIHHWRGPFELECIIQGDDAFLIEINPRFPAWVYFATAVGVNLPARLLRLMLGQPTETRSEYEPGRLFVRYSYDMVASQERFQHTLTTGQSI